MTDDPLQALADLYARHTGAAPTSIRRLAGDGSARRIYRLGAEGRPSRVGVIGPNARENEAFVAFTEAFLRQGLPVPTVHEVDTEAGAWLEDDLGDETLYEAVVAAREDAAGPFPPALLDTYRRVVSLLARFQVEGAAVVPLEKAWPRAAQDATGVVFDLNAFLFQFVRPAGVAFDEVEIEVEFEHLARRLVPEDPRYFQHRDFQSRNLMLKDGETWVLDYQNGRLGGLGYDLASLLHDAKARIPMDVREDLLEHYLVEVNRVANVDETSFCSSFELSVVLRTLQALGAYGLRGLTERKPSFLARIPDRLDDVEALLAAGGLDAYPTLRGVLDRCCAVEVLRRRPPPATGPLTVHVGSFSYKRGYPRDRGGHGGGMVFDCRAVENPGREARFRALTGRDDAVIVFLDRAPSAQAFLRHVLALVDAQVEAYRDRAFTAFDVSFGCTGGQHRSVYFAEHTARHLRERHPDVGVQVVHAELDD